MTLNLKVVMNTDACLTDTPQLQLRNTCAARARPLADSWQRGISTGYPLDEFLEQKHHFQGDHNTRRAQLCLSFILIFGILGLRDAEELIGQ